MSETANLGQFERQTAGQESSTVAVANASLPTSHNMAGHNHGQMNLILRYWNIEILLMQSTSGSYLRKAD
jgi:hypothetical protein